MNEQYIKPVTQQAGKMSWALMRHPDGLECELFISHAWQEGVFEFLAKVRHSWPRSVHTAWCCMLANPQKLRHLILSAITQDFPFCSRIGGIQSDAGGTKPTPECVHEALVLL